MPLDEDIENMPGQEYIEDSFDFYKFDFRRSNSDTLELSKVLQPLSLSQQNIQAQLDEDLKLLDVSGSVKTEEKEACPRDQIPSYIQHHPPGLHLFKEDSPLIFQLSDLNLIRDFNWSGLSRLYKSGVDQKILTKMMSSKEEDLFTFVRYLTPEVATNNLIKSKENFDSVVRYVFYLTIFCEDELLHSVMRKCLLDLFFSYECSWSPSLAMFTTVLTNLGADPELISNQAFFEDILDNFTQPANEAFLENLKETTVKKEVNCPSVEDRNVFITRLFETFSELLKHPGRKAKYFRDTISKQDVKSFIFLTSLIVQDVHCCKDPGVAGAAAEFLRILLSRLKDNQEDLQDVAEILSTRFLPRQLSDTCCRWSQAACPGHMRDVPGHNHPHNMVHLLNIIPNVCRSFKQVLAYVFIQMILGIESIDLPDSCSVSEVMTVLRSKSSTWRMYSDSLQYTSWCLLQLVDKAVDPHKMCKFGTENYRLMKELDEYIEKHNVRNRWKDTKNIDESMMLEKAKEIRQRWKVFMDRTENVASLKKQLSQEPLP